MYVCIHAYVCMHARMYVVVVQFFPNPFFSPNNGCGQIYLVLLWIVLTHSLHLERALASLAVSTNFLLCSTTTFSQVFVGLHLFPVLFTLISSALLRKLFLSFLNSCPFQRKLLALAR